MVLGGRAAWWGLRLRVLARHRCGVLRVPLGKMRPVPVLRGVLQGWAAQRTVLGTPCPRAHLDGG